MAAILNLGAGAAPIPGAINVDLTKLPGVQVAYDLNILPWPWADASFDIIVARSVLEHLDLTLVQSVNECWRLLRAGGQLELKLPYWDHDHCWEDPTHRRGYSIGVFDYFDDSTEAGRIYGHYTPRKWRVLWRGFTNGSRSSVGAKMGVVK